ncbi:hypothetical protein [Streptomyces sp. NPDC004270]
MKEHGIKVPPSVDWDAGVGILSITAHDPVEHSQRSVVTFHSRTWIALDRHARPTTVDILDVPEVVARVVPRALRGQDAEPDTGSSIPWLLDTDSDWVWISLGGAPTRNRLVREGRVEVWLAGRLPLRLRLWAPVGGTADCTGGKPA